MSISGVEAVIFDMDGTLIDSEQLAEQIVVQLLRERGLPPPAGDLARFHGVTWVAIARMIAEEMPELGGESLAEELQAAFHAAFFAELPPEIPGARAAVLGAGARMPTAIASSSNRESVELVIDRLRLGDVIAVTVCAEDCTRSKPDPEPYEIAARRLGRAPDACLVFEDSLAGLQAARAAGMRTVAITRHKAGESLARARELADLAIEDYRELPADFFAAVAGGAR